MTKFHEACREVINSSNNDYAKAYAKAGLNMYSHDEISSQALYILSNLSRWSGTLARDTKKILKEFI